MSPDLVVVHSPVGGGHKSAALAIAEAARARSLTVEVLDTFEHAPRVFGKAYVTAHLTWTGALPELYGAAYFRANHRDGALEPLRRAADHVAWAGLVKRVVGLAPRAVIATHHLPLVVLGRARRKGKLHCPLIGVVTDYGTHAVWAEKGLDALCVPGAGALRDALAHRFPARLLHATGIPVRHAFETIPPVRDPARGEALRVLVTSGGFGVGPIRDIVRSFAGISGVELTVVCGRAPGLERRVARLAAAAGVKARVLGFERDMPSRMAEAHVIVGKAGGLTVSEAMTSGRPDDHRGRGPRQRGHQRQPRHEGRRRPYRRPRRRGHGRRRDEGAPPLPEEWRQRARDGHDARRRRRHRRGDAHRRLRSGQRRGLRRLSLASRVARVLVTQR
jgi:processive 1,2-diacylglycerol beta-glucosyltransferase